MTSKLWTLIALFMTSILPSAWAHPEVFEKGFMVSLAHMLQQADHLVVLLLMGAVIYQVRHYLKKRQQLTNQHSKSSQQDA